MTDIILQRPRTFLLMVVWLLSCILLQTVTAQIIPEYRGIDWRIAGAASDFSFPGPVIDVTTMGAVGDGVTDDFAAVSAALNSLGGSSGTLYFPPGEYLIMSTLHLPDSVTLRGNGSGNTALLFDVGENAHGIQIAGTVTGDFTSIMSGYQKGSTQITLADTVHFAFGDVAEILQDGHHHMTSAWAMNTLGQIVVVDSVAGNKLYLRDPLRLDYADSLNPRIRRVQPRQGVSIECLTIRRLDSTGSSTANIWFHYAYNCRIHGVESHLGNFAHVDIRRSSNITVRNSYFHEAHDYGVGGNGYGVCVHSTSGACLVLNNIFQQLRHAMLLQSGANGNVLAYNYSLDPFWIDPVLPPNSAGDIALHGNYPYLNLFEGNIVQNIVIDDSHGKNGHHNTFFRNRAELYGIFMNNNPATDSVNFVGNEVTNTGILLGFYFLNGANHFQYGNNVKGDIMPAGTGNLPEVSLLYDHPPVWWFSGEPMPPIGPPQLLNIHGIPAKTRFASGAHFATCADTPFVISVHPVPVQPTGTFQILSCGYRPGDHTLVLQIRNQCEPARFLFEVYNLTGALTSEHVQMLDRGDHTVTIRVNPGRQPSVRLISVSNGRERQTCKNYQ
jgi:hypothetical protein